MVGTRNRPEPVAPGVVVIDFRTEAAESRHGPRSSAVIAPDLRKRPRVAVSGPPLHQAGIEVLRRSDRPRPSRRWNATLRSNLLPAAATVQGDLLQSLLAAASTRGTMDDEAQEQLRGRLQEALVQLDEAARATRAALVEARQPRASAQTLSA